MLARWPGELAAAKDVEVKVVDGLTSRGAIVDDNAETCQNVKR